MYKNRGYVYEKQGKYEKAEVDYSKAIALFTNEDDKVNTYASRGNVYEKLDMLTKAQVDFAKVKEINNKDISNKSRLAAFILCTFLGWVGAHRFYVNRPCTAIFMVLLFLTSLLWK